MSDQTGRFLDGSLSPEEARKLAQESLDDPKLFGELTEAALVKAALNRETVRAPRNIRAKIQLVVIGAAAAVLAAGMVVVFRVNRLSPGPPPVIPTLTASAKSPVLLAHGLEPGATTVFRGDTAETRAPQISGSVTSVEDGLVNINLGSLDGLSKGSELAVFRGAQNIGKVRVDTVFRDRARAVPADKIAVRTKDEVRVAPSDHLNALVDQANAQFQRSDSNGAIRSLEQATQAAQAEGVSPSQLAPAWNQLATMHVLQGDTVGAQSLLSQAHASAADDAIRAESMNNLAVIAEMEGDRKKAKAGYTEALKTATGEDRPTIESNLARLRGVH